MGIELASPELGNLAFRSLEIAGGSSAGAHDWIGTAGMNMLGVGGIDHFDHAMKSVGHDSSETSSSLGRKQRSSVSSRRSDTPVELEEGERAGRKGPRMNSEACSRCFG